MENRHQDEPLRYQTSSGFVVQTFSWDQGLPFFDSAHNSMVWYQPNASFEGGLTQTDFCCSNQGYSAEYAQFSDWIDLPASYNTEIVVWTNDSSDSQVCLDLSVPTVDQFDCAHTFYVASVVENQVQSSLRCLEQTEKQIIGHRPHRLVLMAGREYLISRFERERSEASARQHVTHLEVLILSREHSGQSAIPGKAQDSRFFGWRTWSRHSGSSSFWSTLWSRSTRVASPCLSSGITSDPTS